MEIFAKNRHNCVTIHDFWEILIYDIKASSEIPENISIISDLFATELMWDPAEHLVSLAENQHLENTNFMEITAKNRHNCVIIRDFWEILIYGIKASSEISRKYFNNLRFVCNRAHVRSRRAPCVFGRKSEFVKHELYGDFCQ